MMKREPESEGPKDRPKGTRENGRVSSPDRRQFEHRPVQEPVADGETVTLPRPYLDTTSNYGPQITVLQVDEAGTVSFTVWNDGNYPAWTCYVDVYEGPDGHTGPLSAHALRGRRIITLHPGERQELELPRVCMQETGCIVGIIWLQSYEVHASETHDRLSDTLAVRAGFQKPDGTFSKSNELNVSRVLVSIHGVTRRFELQDHGIELDKVTGDDSYTSVQRSRVQGQDAKLTHVPEEDRPGYSNLFVFAQDVNTVLQRVEPFEAAHTIDGFIWS